jgi:hypothetical protein
MPETRSVLYNFNYKSAAVYQSAFKIYRDAITNCTKRVDKNLHKIFKIF